MGTQLFWRTPPNHWRVILWSLGSGSKLQFQRLSRHDLGTVWNKVIPFWWFRNLARKPPWDGAKTCRKSWDFNYIPVPQLVKAGFLNHHLSATQLDSFHCSLFLGGGFKFICFFPETCKNDLTTAPGEKKPPISLKYYAAGPGGPCCHYRTTP